jgi:hypothetical protein
MRSRRTRTGAASRSAPALSTEALGERDALDGARSPPAASGTKYRARIEGDVIQAALPVG